MVWGCYPDTEIRMWHLSLHGNTMPGSPVRSSFVISWCTVALWCPPLFSPATLWGSMPPPSLHSPQQGYNAMSSSLGFEILPGGEAPYCPWGPKAMKSVIKLTQAFFMLSMQLISMLFYALKNKTDAVWGSKIRQMLCLKREVIQDGPSKCMLMTRWRMLVEKATQQSNWTHVYGKVRITDYWTDGSSDSDICTTFEMFEGRLWWLQDPLQNVCWWGNSSDEEYLVEKATQQSCKLNVIRLIGCTCMAESLIFDTAGNDDVLERSSHKWRHKWRNV